MLRELKAKWVLTINDHPLLKRLYKGFHACSYFTSLSSQKVEKNHSRKQLNNLIISGYIY